MTRFSGALVGTILGLSLPASARAQQPPSPTSAPPIVREVRFAGTHDVTNETLQRAARVRVGEPLPIEPGQVDDLAERLVRYYKDEGFTFARVHAAFDDSTAVLSFDVDEGVIDGVEFTGVDDKLKRSFEEDFALRAGDTFNRSKARQALDVLLRPTRGAVRPARGGSGSAPGTTFTDSTELPGRHDTFNLIDRGGQRILIVGLYEPAGRFRMLPDLGDREDWFSSVDGFVPSLGFGAAVFDHTDFNHSYVAGHISYKVASERAGYALGFERPFFKTRKLYVGGELHDLTASDDQWQVSSLEASLAALGPRKSFRDYYRRRGVQIGAQFRPHPQVEIIGLWRTEREEPLPVTTDFSFWNSDDPFRPNRPAVDGHLNALVVGATLDGGGLERESLDTTYRRHQLDTFFGQALDYPPAGNDPSAIWRIDWTTEISTPDVLESDFDFTRSIVSARYRKPLSTHQDFGVRAIGGWSSGVLPTQRLFSVGGVGSVHGYDFKEQTGTSLALLNLEYALGWRRGFKVLGFFDVGRASTQAEWLKGVGFGAGVGDFRVDFGYRTDDVPSSLQVVLRFSKTF